MVLVQLSVVEQRLDAVRAVLAGATATEVAAAIGVSRPSVHTWIARYLVEGLGGLADRSRRPASCPHEVSTVVEVKVGEMRGSICDGVRSGSGWSCSAGRWRVWGWCRRRPRSTGS